MEIWKPVLGFETRYEVSSWGRVRVASSGRLRKPQAINKGYLVVKLVPLSGGKQLTRTIHSLVAEAFLSARPAGAQVNHKDGRKKNNRLDNLEWTTPAENMAHARATGLRSFIPTFLPTLQKPQTGEGNFNAKLSESQASEIIRLLQSGRPGRALAREFGVSSSLVHAIKVGRAWSHLPR